MITNISIKNFAVIKDLNADFKPGLNVITGETGSGKSVIIEAIAMALGSRADTSYVRKGADKACLSLVVDTDDCDISEFLDNNGIDNENPLIIRRDILSVGKSVCRINGSPVPVSMLNSLCKKIVDIHGQYDQQLLLDDNNHLGILDRFGGYDIAAQLSRVENAFKNLSSAEKKLCSLKKSLNESERKRDFLSYEIKEISDAHLKPGEDEELEENVRLMQNSENLYQALDYAHSELSGSDASAESSMGNAMNALSKMKGISSEIDSLAERIANVYYEISDVNSSIRTMRDRVSFSREELDEAIERLELINKLKRKYGNSVNEIIKYAENSSHELEHIENADEELLQLTSAIKELKKIFYSEADVLSSLRKTCASDMEKKINKELSELNFVNCVFKVNFSESEPSEKGTDSVAFLISANIGEDPKPLSRVASGGELSRIMLALKSVLSESENIPTMIFDEIDTGISGAAAAVVGEKLTAIAKKHQVFCITHLPQIACKGNTHFRISKSNDGSSTYTRLDLLGINERIEEVARLMSGTEVSDNARSQAKELIGVR